MARKFVNATPSYLTSSFGAINSYPFTIMGWFNSTNPTGIGTNPTIVACGHTSSNADTVTVGILTSTGKLFSLLYDDNASGYDLQQPTPVISANTWYSFAFSAFSATNRTTYLNGGNAVNSSAGVSISSSLNTTTTIGIYNASGGVLAGTGFDGQIAEVCFWNAALTAGEVGAFNLGRRAKEIRPESFAGWYPIDGLASPEPDYSGNARNMTLIGAPAQANGPPISAFTRRHPLSTISVASSFIPAWAVPSNKISSGCFAT